MQSQAYHYLRQRIAELNAHFLCVKRLDGDYTLVEIQQLHALILLAHAEIESYLEKRALELVDGALRKWQEIGEINNVLNSLILSNNKIEKLSESRQDAGNSIEAVIKDVVRLYKVEVANNNGISSKCLFQLLLPLGFSPSMFEEKMLADLSDLSTKRGKIAHHAQHIAIQKKLDPYSETQQIDEIIASLALVDSLFSKFKKR